MFERLLSGFRRPRTACTGPFDTIISLGFNCEVSFRIRDYLEGHLDSYPFSWCYVYGNASLPRIFSHPEQILSGAITLQPNGMLRCETCHLAFHSKTPLEQLLPPEGSVSDAVYTQTVEELKSRVAHMTEKFQTLLEGERCALFLMKNAKIALAPTQAREDIAELSLWLESHYKGGRYLLVVVVEEPYLTPALRRLENDHLTFRAVRAFAKEGKAQSGGDHEGWDAILREFDPDKHAMEMFSPIDD